ncbi:autoinducer binding domain-containing protein [Bradyrhizobium sp. BRP22]|nr:autoinducer binding domain-containing protein [Bradyrhizobium sp. BRP22]
MRSRPQITRMHSSGRYSAIAETRLPAICLFATDRRNADIDLAHPKSRTNRYFQLGYQQLDPVVRCARLEYGLFGWGGKSSSPSGEREQRRFFGEATTFSFQPLWDWITEAEPVLFN